MSDTAETLAKVQDSLARVRSFLKNFDDDLAECTRFSFFRSWPRRIELLSGNVSSLALQVTRLTNCVESICDALKQSDSSSR